MSEAPNVEAFVGGVEIGLYAAMLAISLLLVIATVRRLLAV